MTTPTALVAALLVLLLAWLEASAWALVRHWWPYRGMVRWR